VRFVASWPTAGTFGKSGCNPKQTKHQVREALKPVAADELLRELALSFNVDHSTFWG
jgi:hypothetical protein